MDAKSFRATWSPGGWRTVPSLFGTIVVQEGGITAHSRLLFSWVKDQEVTRDSIEVIRVARSLGVMTFVIQGRDGKRLEFNLRGADGDLMLRALEQRGYVVDSLTN
jgi:hypothetical protein